MIKKFPEQYGATIHGKERANSDQRLREHELVEIELSQW
jgi:hypothetical protein